MSRGQRTEDLCVQSTYLCTFPLFAGIDWDRSFAPGQSRAQLLRHLGRSQEMRDLGESH
jgi:hypothetical protein